MCINVGRHLGILGPRTLCAYEAAGLLGMADTVAPAESRGTRVKSFSALDLIGAHEWRRATFTTYSFSASFAEAVLVEALMRQGVSEITVLTDPLGYRMALRERGAVRIGREYIVHPVAVQDGCFHPKVMVLEAADAVHATVGSGNMTFGGWSANLECIEHVYADGRAGALSDLGRFFTALADSAACEHDARDHCRELGGRLAATASGGTDEGRLRTLSSLDGAIADRIVAAAADLGGARSLTMASPYWELGAVEALAYGLGLDAVAAHVPPSRVPAPKGMDWPRGSPVVRPVEVAALAADGVSRRGLHAKVFEVGCAAGRIVVSGSANATTAGLTRGGEAMRNVEVCALRVDPAKGGRWKSAPAKAPPQPVAFLDDEDGDADRGVLTAEHADGGIRGRIITRWRSSSATAIMEVNRRPVDLGLVRIDAGRFYIPVELVDHEDLDLEGRVQLLLVGEGEEAEGFVAAPDFAAVKGRAGKSLASMLAIMKNMQTPEDVLAVMEFFRKNPEALKTRTGFRARSEETQHERPDPLVDPDLVGRGGDTGEPSGAGGAGAKGSSEQAWQKFVARLLHAFARAGSVTEDEEDEGDRTEKARRLRAARAMAKIGVMFPQFFNQFVDRVETDVELVNVIRMTHFVCVTTSQPSTDALVARLVTVAGRINLGEAARDTVAWCLAYLAAGGLFAAAEARARMMTAGIDPDREPDAGLALPGFAELLAPEAEMASVLAAIRATRTVHDDVRTLEAGLLEGRMPDGLSALPLHEGWEDLKRLCAAPGRRRVHFVDRPVAACPSCNITLLPYLKSELARKGVCETRCHGFILARNP